MLLFVRWGLFGAGLAVVAGCSAEDAGTWSPRGGSLESRAELPRPPRVEPRGAFRLVVKFRDEVRARVGATGRMAAYGVGDVSGVAAVLEDRGLQARPWLEDPARVQRLADRAGERSRRLQPDFGGIVAVDGERSRLLEVATALEADPSVELVWFERLGVPPPVDLDPPTPSFVDLQGYLLENAMNVVGAWELGLDGAGVRLTDVEYGWQVTHEEFTEIDTGPEPGQTTHPDAFAEGFVDHGTAVIGILSADPAGFGVTGMAPLADLHTYPEWTLEEGFRRPTAVANALSDSGPGDVVLLEMQQEENITGLLGPAELDIGIWMLTRAASDAGVIVVAAAGNGGLDLDSIQLNYYTQRGDSGALMVGAGQPGTREPFGYSTFGERVNVQAWGDGVATTAYGDLAQVGGDLDQFYTALFAGTSSASALVAGVATLVQQSALLTGSPLTPEQMRQVLIGSGRPQAPGPLVGPLPDAGAAALVAMSPEQEPPSVTIVVPEPTVTEAQSFETDIVVDAVDDSGHVARVQLEINGEAQGSPDEDEPFEFSNVVFPAGSWEVVAIAEDVWGTQGRSDPLLVEVGVDVPSPSTGEPPGASTGEPPPMGTTSPESEPTGGPIDTSSPADGDSSGCGCSNGSGRHPLSFAQMIILALLGGVGTRRQRRTSHKR